MPELVGVTVTVGVIFDCGGGVDPAFDPPPLHAMASAAMHVSVTMASSLRQLRRRAGMQKNRRHAIAEPPAANQRLNGGGASDPVVGAVVKIVSVAVEAPVPEMARGLEVPKLNVGRSAAPDGFAVICAVNVTLPAKPPDGVTVIIEVLPVVAPGATVTLRAARVNPG
jgi:hypothetical protein